MSRGRLSPIVGTILVVAMAAAAVAFGATGPPLKTTKLFSCLQLRGGLAQTGIRSTAFSYGVDQDPNVVALVAVSGKDPRPSVSTAIVTRGRKPFSTELFANVRLDEYVFHKNGVSPRPGAMSAAKRFLSQTITACVKAAK